MLGWLNALVSKIAVKSGYGLAELARRFASAADESNGASEDVDITQPYGQSVWVHAAIGLIADAIATCPLVIKSGDNIVSSGPVLRITEQPNRHQNLVQFVTETMTRLLLDGHVFWERRGMQGNRPTEVLIWPLCKFVPDIRTNEFGDDYAFRWLRQQTGEPLIPGDELFEWKLFNPYSDIYGLAPLSPASLALYCDVATGLYNKKFFQNGARADLVFTSDDDRFTQDQATQAQERWNAAHRGVRNSRRTAFMGNSLKPHLIGYTFSDMEFPELKRMSKAEILAIFHVPDTLLGAQPKGTGVEIGGNGRKPDEENFILNTVMPWASRLAWLFDHVVLGAFGRYTSEFDFRQVPILQDRLLERAKEGREWIKAGATFNDVNEKFGLGFKPQPTGDDWWVPSNMLPGRLLMNGPIAADPGRQFDDSADAKDAKKSLKLAEAA